MAADPRQLGFITLFSTRKRACGAMPGRYLDPIVTELRQAFRSGRLVACVWFPDRKGKFVVPSHLWDAEGFPDRVFHADDVAIPALATGWEPYEGRTTFVAEASFREWLEERVSAWVAELDARPDCDPMRLPRWTILMAAAWIATRSTERVRWQISEYRKARTDYEPTILEASTGGSDPELADEQRFFPLEPALSDLLTAATGGDVVAHGLDRMGLPSRIEPEQWAYGALETDGEGRPRLAVGSRASRLTQRSPQFTEITFERAAILSKWPVVVVGPSRPEAVRSAQTAMVTIQKPRRVASHQQKAIMAYLTAECDRQWPDGSLNEIADSVVRWVTSDRARSAEHKIGAMDRHTIFNFVRSPWWAWYQQQTATLQQQT